MTIYLDYNATAPLRPAVGALMSELWSQPLNASAVHGEGRLAKKYLEDARKSIAEAISCFPNDVIFTASGSEANATALNGFSGRRLLVSAVEHSSVFKAASLRGKAEAIQPAIDGSTHFTRDDVIPVDTNGVVDRLALEAMLADGPPALVSIMLANNETGVIQPIREIAAICRKHGALLHTDAVQALGKIPVDFTQLGADMMTISAHKMGGPVGAAALVLRQDLAIKPLITGGGQELGRRAGTENIAAIAGFAKAVELIDLLAMKALRGWLDKMESEIIRAGGVVLGANADRLPNTSCFAMPGVSNEVQLMNLDLSGFAVSAGSACSSGRVEPSPVLAAMGVDKSVANCAIRVSGGWATTAPELESVLNTWQLLQKRLKAA